MRILQLFVSTAVCLALTPAPAGAVQKAKRHHSRYAAAPVPSTDAVELGTLAPPSPAFSTLQQSYGDAAIARAHFQRRYEEQAPALEAEANGPVQYPCDPRSADAGGYTCRNPPSAIGYGQTYAFTPSFVSAPQTVGKDPTAQSSLLPPFTALFYAVNGLRYDPHN